MSAHADQRADLIAARATGLGVGLIGFMLTWTIGARLAERAFDAPMHAYVAMAIALVAGAVTSAGVGRRLVRDVVGAPRAVGLIGRGPARNSVWRRPPPH